MSAVVPSFQCWRVWQLVDACLVVAVCSFVFFDLLDLDGSNFSLLKSAHAERAVAVAEPPAVNESSDCRVDESHPTPLTLDDVNCSEPSVQKPVAAVSHPAPLFVARAHGYRSGLPRGEPTH